MTNTEEVTLQDLLWDDAQQYIQGLDKEFPDNRSKLIELVHAHRLLARIEASKDLPNE